MGFDTQDKELVRLITKLKESNGKYPPELLAARRQRYLKQMAQVSVGLGVGTGFKNAAKNGKAPALSPTTSTILEAALVVAIAAETGTVAYFYRDKLAEIFQSIKNREEPKAEQISPSPIETEQEIQGVTAAPAIAATQPSSLFVPGPTTIESAGTPIPNVVQENNTVGITSTPAPNLNSENNTQHGNNGNHYGQTPKPQRTKDLKNDNSNNNDKPPKDSPKPPKDNPNPPKAK